MKNMTPIEASKALIAEMRRESPSILRVEQYLAQGADVNYQSAEDGYTALMLAASIVEEDSMGQSITATILMLCLLEHGANPLVRNYRNEIASDLALGNISVYQHLKDVELLLATLNNDLGSVKAALLAGADVNFRERNGYYSPLLIAVKESQLEMVELLLSHGADIDIGLCDGLSVFDLCVDKSIFDLLDKKRTSIREADQIPREPYMEKWQKAQLERIAAGQPFDLSELKIYSFYSKNTPVPSEEQLAELEQYFCHPLPALLKEIFLHYNGGSPRLDYFDAINSIRYFYSVSENRNAYGNIWSAITSYSEYLGPETLPFAEGTNGQIYYLKWVGEQAQVWQFLYGYEMIDEDDCDDEEDYDEDTFPTAFNLLSKSLDEFLERLYEEE